MPRLRDDLERLMRLPPKKRAVLAGIVSFVALIAILTEIWPFLLFVAALLFGLRYGKKRATAASAPRLLSHAATAAAAARPKARKGLEPDRAAAAAAVTAAAAAAAASVTARAPPPHPIVEDGGSLWRWRRLGPGRIVE